MIRRKLTALSMLAMFVITTMCLLLMPGCGGATVQATWAVENRDYHDAVVKDVLLPHYNGDPKIPQVEKDNVNQATTEHEQNLDEWESTQPASPFANLFGGGTNTDP